MTTVDSAERRARVGRRHLLAPSARVDELAAVADGMVGLHSSDPATVFLSARARMRNPSIAAIEDALYEQRTVARVLGMRRTMFVVPLDMVAVLDRGAAVAFVAREEQRLAGYVESEGITDEGLNWVRRVKAATLAALEARGEAVATELTEDVPELGEKLTFGEGKTWGGQVGVSTRILFLMATDGSIVRARPRGSWLSSQYRWALRRSWLNYDLPDISTPTARADLLRRWLATFGPGTLADIRWWTGWTKTVAVRTLAELEAHEIDVDGTPMYIRADDAASMPTEEWAALLPSLDPTPMGWKDRDWYVADRAGELFDRNGNIGPTIWANGSIVGGWAQAGDGDIRLELFDDLGPSLVSMVEAEAEAVGAFVEGAVVTPRFRTPLERRLLA